MELIRARAGSTGVIMFHCSRTIRLRLGLDPQRDRLALDYGFGDEHFHLRLIRALPHETAVIPVFPSCAGFGFNLRTAFMPRAMEPASPLTIPHGWSGRYLLLDYRPLQISRVLTKYTLASM